VAATIVFMSAVPARDLRNHTAEVLRRVEAGEEIEVLRDNRPVAKIVPLSRRRQWLPAAEIAQELARLGPVKTGLAMELRETLTETTDDLRW
jgi:prevent-host-death family protein